MFVAMKIDSRKVMYTSKQHMLFFRAQLTRHASLECTQSQTHKLTHSHTHTLTHICTQLAVVSQECNDNINISSTQIASRIDTQFNVYDTGSKTMDYGKQCC